MPSRATGAIAIANPDPESRGGGPSEEVYRGLLRGLYEGAFVPGQRLVAPDLMSRFGVGRGTIREVLHRLASSGVVKIEPNRGARMRRLSRREVNEILDIVEMLLGLAARRAASAIDRAENLRALETAHEALRPQTALADFGHFLVAREAYYRTIVRLAGNQELQRLFPAAQIHIMRVQLRRFQHAADSVHLSDYAGLTEAILSGDPDAAEAAGRAHVEQTRVRVADLPESAFAT